MSVEPVTVLNEPNRGMKIISNCNLISRTATKRLNCHALYQKYPVFLSASFQRRRHLRDDASSAKIGQCSRWF